MIDKYVVRLDKDVQCLLAKETSDETLHSKSEVWPHVFAIGPYLLLLALGTRNSAFLQVPWWTQKPQLWSPSSEHMTLIQAAFQKADRLVIRISDNGAYTIGVVCDFLLSGKYKKPLVRIVACANAGGVELLEIQ
jgi:hypothetical protein